MSKATLIEDVLSKQPQVILFAVTIRSSLPKELLPNGLAWDRQLWLIDQRGGDWSWQNHEYWRVPLALVPGLQAKDIVSHCNNEPEHGGFASLLAISVDDVIGSRTEYIKLDAAAARDVPGFAPEFAIEHPVKMRTTIRLYSSQRAAEADLCNDDPWWPCGDLVFPEVLQVTDPHSGMEYAFGKGGRRDPSSR